MKSCALAAVHSYFFPFIKMCLTWNAIHLKVLLHISPFPLELDLEFTAFSLDIMTSTHTKSRLVF